MNVFRVIIVLMLWSSNQSEESLVGPGLISVVHLDVEDFSEELLRCLLCHKEPAPRIQSPLLGALERKKSPTSKDRVDRTCRLLKRRYLFVLFCSVFLSGLPRAADQNICKQSWAAQAQLCYRKCLFPAKTEVTASRRFNSLHVLSTRSLGSAHLHCQGSRTYTQSTARSCWTVKLCNLLSRYLWEEHVFIRNLFTCVPLITITSDMKHMHIIKSIRKLKLFGRNSNSIFFPNWISGFESIDKIDKDISNELSWTLNPLSFFCSFQIFHSAVLLVGSSSSKLTMPSLSIPRYYTMRLAADFVAWMMLHCSDCRGDWRRFLTSTFERGSLRYEPEVIICFFAMSPGRYCLYTGARLMPIADPEDFNSLPDYVTWINGTRVASKTRNMEKTEYLLCISALGERKYTFQH